MQGQDIHPGLSKHPKLTAFGMLRDKLANRIFFHSTDSRDSSHLLCRRRRTDMRIKTTSGSRDQIHRNGKRIVGVGNLECIAASLYGLHQHSIGPPKIGPGPDGSVVAER